MVIISTGTLDAAGTIPTPYTYMKLAMSIVIPIIIIAPIAPPIPTTNHGSPVIVAAVIRPVKPAPAANIAVPVPTPVAVAIAAGAPPTGIKCTPAPIITPPIATNKITKIGSIIETSLIFLIWSVTVSCKYF